MKRLLLALISRFNDDEVLALGSQLAYNLLLSFFPFIIFIMTLVGHISLNDNEILATLSKIMPVSAFSLISTTVSEVVNTKHSQLMSFSLLLTIWSSSSGFNAVIKGLNKAYGVRESRNFMIVKVISILCTLAMALILLVMVSLLIFGRILWNFAIYKLGFSHELAALWVVIRYSIVIFTAIFSLSALYRYAPCKRLTWQEVLPGALFATFDLILESLGFAFYVNNFANYSVVYGSIGAIIILLIWIFMISIIVILGGEVNAFLAHKSNSTTMTHFKHNDGID